MRRFPALSTAKHEDIDGHDSPVTRLVPTCATDHADPPPAGSVVPNKVPVASDAKHKGPDQHQTPPGALGEMLTYLPTAPVVGFQVTTVSL